MIMIKIHQTLHGYNQGHHLLSATVMPKSSEDMQMMSLMSDWDGFDSGYDNPVEYLTAYPLSDYYVVAKTWYAYEMPRPGCVWTHSLLIDKQDLDKIADFRLLISLFRRPQEKDGFTAYGKDIEIKDDLVKKEGQQDNTINYGVVYLSLLSGQKPLVYPIERENAFYQEMVLLLMNYVPGQILSNLSFSSGSTTPRRIKDKLMSLQFSLSCPGDFDNLRDEKNWGELTSINYIHHGIAQGRTDIRKLLQIFKSDIDGSVDHWIHIINLFVQLSVISHVEDADKGKFYLALIEQLGGYFPSKEDGNTLKYRFTLPELTERLLDNYHFLLETCTNKIFSVFTGEQIHLQERFGRLIKNEGHSCMTDLLLDIKELGIQTEIGFQLYLLATSIMDETDFLRLLDEDYTVLVTMIPMNNQIINNKAWIVGSKENFERIFSLFGVKAPEQFDYWTELFDAVIRNESFVMETAWQEICGHVEHPVERLLNLLNQKEGHLSVSPAIIEECGNNRIDMMVWLKEHPIKNLDVARFFIKNIGAESEEVRHSRAEDWKNFMISHNIEDTDYYVYLYNLSFNWPKSELGFEFFKKAFYPLYALAQTSRLQDRYWSKIAHNTVNLWIADWDKCKKMRLMAARRAMWSKVEETSILSLTPDFELNMEILKYYKRMKGKK